MRSCFSRFFYCFCLVLLCILDILNFPVASCYAVSLNGFSNLTRVKRAEACYGFVCATTKECISEEKRCDGTVDCKDGSDEFNDCKTAVRCPGFLFTCDYGACIETTKRCDGKKDCRDNSDESNCVDTQVASDKGGNCKSDQFECISGHCISIEDKCNGIHDCADKSDETKEVCLNVRCPGFTYKCDYGACVDGYAQCNGVKDCVDNSDEEGCKDVVPEPVTPGPTVAPVEGMCVLPKFPVNGKWSVYGGITLPPGRSVTANTLIIFECNQGYKLSEENKYMLCSEDGWDRKLPTCKKLCSPLYSTDVTKVKCFDEKVEISCAQAAGGSYVEYECERFYETSDRTKKRFCLASGEWNLQPPQCVPVCGEKRVSAEPLIVKGKPVERGTYPWITAVYLFQDGEYINNCGGSMLTQKVILTAAHCVSNDYGDPLPLEEIIIAVGKYFNKYEDPRDSQAQYSQIEKVVVHPKYKGDSQRYGSDIAFLITKDKLAFSKVCQPVCYNNVDHIHLKLNQVGVVTGWGYTVAGGTPSDELQEIDIPYKDDATCNKELPSDWSAKYLTYDKFCAGHYNKSIAVCKGDSGGGLAFVNADGRYYVHGIVSLAHRVQKGCDVQVSALYTRVAFHYEWLESIIANNWS